MIVRSLRWRIQAWHGLLLVLVVTGFGVTAHRLARAERLRQVDESLQAEATQIAASIPPPFDERPPNRPGSRPFPPLPLDAIPPHPVMLKGHYYVVWRNDGREQAKSENAPADLVRPIPVEQQNFGSQTRGETREFYRYTNTGRCFLVGRSMAAEQAALRRLAWYLAGAGVGVLVLGLTVGWWITTGALRPIAEITATAEKIAGGDLSQRIPVLHASDELSGLAAVLNSTFSRLDAAFTQQARFTADAAHELRTPVTVMLTHAQNGLACEGLNEDAKDSFEACQRAARRMRRLLESLLELARLDAGQETMKRKPIDLAEIARDCLELVEPLTEARSIRLHDHLAPAPCRGDAERVAQVVTNLLSNAIEHNREGGEILVETSCSPSGAQLMVVDSGLGIRDADLPHVFKRFYRADIARSGGNVHAGLGLAISRAIAEAHGGTLEVANAPGAGAMFTLRLPEKKKATPE